MWKDSLITANHFLMIFFLNILAWRHHFFCRWVNNFVDVDPKWLFSWKKRKNKEKKPMVRKNIEKKQSKEKYEKKQQQKDKEKLFK